MPDEVHVYVVEFGDRPNFQLQWRDPITQRLRTKTTGVKRTGLRRDRHEAERLAGELQRQLEAGNSTAPSRLSWEEFRNRYESEEVAGFATLTGVKIQTVLDRVEAELNPQRLRDLTPARLSHLVKTLRTDQLSENTIVTYLAHLHAALNWAHRQQMIAGVPEFPKIQRAKKGGRRLMKGRPPTGEEFERMLEVVPDVVGEGAASHWRHYLRGLWTSGLRLTESLDLWWDREDKLFPVFPVDGHPMLKIHAELEKGNRDRLLPIVPEFAMFLLETPDSERVGPIFRLEGRRGRLTAPEVSRRVSEIGKAAGVRVYVSPKTGKEKWASAHDLRRAFGTRWAKLVMPPELQILMRHESLETTLRYYIETDAQSTAASLWAAFHRSGGPKPTPAPNESSNMVSENTPLPDGVTVAQGILVPFV